MIRLFRKREEPVNQHPPVSAVVVAAGGSTRMGVPKQLIPLRGVPVIARTLLALDAAELVDEIVLVARQEDMLPFYTLCKQYGVRKVTAIVPGAATRQQSVAAGVAAARSGAAYFAIHDGARPLIRPSTADWVIEEAFACGAAAAAVPVKDTVKEADENGFIAGTPDRSRLWNVQTPQVFEADLYRRAMEQAAALGEDFTDDCQLVERMGCPVRLCRADYANIKITTPEDVAFAEAILRERDDEWQ